MHSYTRNPYKRPRGDGQIARISPETTGDIFRSALLVLAFWGVLSGLWPALGGMTNQYAGAAESSSVVKPQGVVTAPWDTEISPTQSWIKVHVVSDIDVQVLVFALNTRTIRLSNTSGFASADDFVAIANGKADGRDVTIFGSHGGPVRYRITVHVSDNAKLSNPSLTDANVSYTLYWDIQKMDPMVIVGGLILFNMFFVTEYMLHLRRDIRALSKRVERAAGEGGRAPLASLGTPVAFAAEEPEAPARLPGGLFGRRGRAEKSSPEPAAPTAFSPSPFGPPPPSAAPAPPPASRYAAAPPESFGPPPYAPPYAEQQPESAAYAPPPPLPAAPPPPPPPPPSSARPLPRTPAPPPAPAPPPRPAATQETQEPISKVRCPQCKHIVPVYTAERPTPIKCPNCGKRGMLTK